MVQVSADEVMDSLRALDYPASKQDVVREAERVNAPEKVVRALRSLPLADYASRDEIIRSIPTDPAPDRTAADRAEAARDRTRSHLAEHSRRR